jgi:hypothetical protein
MNRALLLVAAVAAAAVAPTASAQSPFSDVPDRHWAVGAVNELHLRGILTGYPDGTYGGNRAVTRFEFALAGQRALQDAQRRLDADPAASHRSNTAPGMTRAEFDRLLEERRSKLGTRAEVDRLHVDLDQLRRALRELQARAAGLREEVDQMHQELGSMNARATSLRSPRLRSGVHHP